MQKYVKIAQRLRKPQKDQKATESSRYVQEGPRKVLGSAGVTAGIGLLDGVEVG